MSGPSFAWKLQDHRMGRDVSAGQEPSAQKAQAALLGAVRRMGGWRPGLAGGVTRTSGGGWFLRMQRLPDGRFGYSWEEWEPEVL